MYIKRNIPASEVQDYAGAGEAAADACPSTSGLQLSGNQALRQADASGAGLQPPGNQAPLPAIEGGKKFTASAGGNEVNTFGDGTSNDIVDLMVLEKRFELKFTVNPGCMEKLERVRSLLSNRYPRRLELGRLLGILLDEYLDCPEGRIRRREKRKARKQQGSQGRKDKNVKMKIMKSKNDTGMSSREPQSCEKRSRRIPRRVRDKVFARDGGRCTFVGDDGVRCEETDYLQIDHIIPYASGGKNTADNLRLLCADHNRLTAELEYGKDFMKKFYRKE